MLPQFSILQKMYLGNSDHGGLYSNLEVQQYLFKDKSERKLKDNATCILRMSAVLNVTTKEPGSKKGSVKGYYYFYEREPLLKYLRTEYGVPVVSNKTDAFRGQVGIMFIDIAGGEDSDQCSVLLWNGNGFHQAEGILSHDNFREAHLWAAPTGRREKHVGIILGREKLAKREWGGDWWRVKEAEVRNSGSTTVRDGNFL